MRDLEVLVKTLEVWVRDFNNSFKENAFILYSNWMWLELHEWTKKKKPSNKKEGGLGITAVRVKWMDPKNALSLQNLYFIQEYEERRLMEVRVNKAEENCSLHSGKCFG